MLKSTDTHIPTTHKLSRSKLYLKLCKIVWCRIVPFIYIPLHIPPPRSSKIPPAPTPCANPPLSLSLSWKTDSSYESLGCSEPHLARAGPETSPTQWKKLALVHKTTKVSTCSSLCRQNIDPSLPFADQNRVKRLKPLTKAA